MMILFRFTLLGVIFFAGIGQWRIYGRVSWGGFLYSSNENLGLSTEKPVTAQGSRGESPRVETGVG